MHFRGQCIADQMGNNQFNWSSLNGRGSSIYSQAVQLGEGVIFSMLIYTKFEGFSFYVIVFIYSTQLAISLYVATVAIQLAYMRASARVQSAGSHTIRCKCSIFSCTWCFHEFSQLHAYACGNIQFLSTYVCGSFHLYSYRNYRIQLYVTSYMNNKYIASIQL